MLSEDDALVERIQIHAGAVNHLILTDQEIHRGREILSAEKHILSELDLAIKALIVKRDRQQQRVTRFCVALAPHKRIPPELLPHIFLHCLPSKIGNSVVRIPPKPSQAPWVLGQVCSLWRHISRNDPRLWGEATIMDHHANWRTVDSLCEILPSQIILSLKIRTGVTTVTEIIIPHLWRLQKLDLRLFIEAFDELWRSAQPTSFATLQSAAFYIEETSQIISTEIRKQWCARWGELTPFHLARSLRSLTLDAPDEFSPAFLYLDVPWSQLTSLDIIGLKGLGLTTILGVLQKCASLESLNVKFDHTDHTDHFPEGSTLMHALRTLVVKYSVPSAFIYGTDLWKHISTLDLKGVEFSDGRVLHSIIKQCAGLIELIILVPHKGTAHTTEGDLPLPHLTTLRVLGIQDTWIFKSLVTPALTTLGAFLTIQLPDLSPIRNMLITSGCSLFNLTVAFAGERVENRPAEPKGLNDLLTAIPQAVTVKLFYILVEDAILADIGRDILLPRLECLICCPASQEAFLDMLETRLEREFRENRVRLRQALMEIPYDPHESPAVKAAVKSRRKFLKRTYGIEA